MGQRARKKRRSGGVAEAPPPGGREAAAPAGGTGEAAPGGYYARQRARDEAARSGLQPLAPGERPRAVTVAAILAGILALANVVLLAAGWEVDGQRPQVAGTLIFAALMLIGAVAMWHRRYWAVLGFQALLAITVLFAALALLTAGNLQAVLLCVGIIAVCGPLFWFLVRAMARLQLPQRPPR